MVAGLDVYLATVPDSYFDSGKAEDVKQFSQELRLRWDDGGPLRLEGGAYYLRENIRRAEDVKAKRRYRQRRRKVRLCRHERPPG